MLLDLCHIVNQFFGQLPESYVEFKSLIHGLFPKLLDTKVMAQSGPLKDVIESSILMHMLETISKSPFEMPDVIPVENRSYSTSQEIYHEAGFDAYITGLCFIAMSNYLGNSHSIHSVSSLHCVQILLLLAYYSQVHYKPKKFLQ